MKKLFFLLFLLSASCFAYYLASNFKSVSFAATDSWKRVAFANPDSFVPDASTVLLPTYTSCVMVQADGGDLQIADSTNFVVTVVGRAGAFPCEFSPITLKDGQVLTINRSLPQIFVKGSGTATVTSVSDKK